ncbi:hypothetical protein ACFOET_15335 [Parapedobacter deserti]|uniref:Adhesin domain-containing protein n=1 Tax=Parapedobacter deserti TaxID=1912957 RepID=A0ABV7JSB4_9SPHI
MNRFNGLGLLVLGVALAISTKTLAQPAIDFHPFEQDAERLAVLTAPMVFQQDQAHTHHQPLPIPFFGFQKEKIIEKVYSINNKNKISIDNRYGKIRVRNWTRNEVKVSISIRTAENSERKAQEALDRVHIVESKSPNSISFKTEISASDSRWWSSLMSGGDNRALQIDYEVFVPKANALALTNRYGSIELDDRDGGVVISVAYGSLQAGRLNARENSLAITYSEATVAYLNGGDVSVRYGGFALSEADNLKLALSYTSGSEIGVVHREADISLRYSGGFEMGLGPAIRRATVAASYSGVTIRPSAGAAFQFDIAVSYGSFNYDRSRANIGSKAETNSSKSYTGFWNKAINNTVSVSSRYGEVSLR